MFMFGDRVRVKAPNHPLFKYEMIEEATGTFIRYRNAKMRVEIDGTGSQDTEGHNCYGDFDASEVTRIPQSGAQ